MVEAGVWVCVGAGEAAGDVDGDVDGDGEGCEGDGGIELFS